MVECFEEFWDIVVCFIDDDDVYGVEICMCFLVLFKEYSDDE